MTHQAHFQKYTIYYMQTHPIVIGEVSPIHADPLVTGETLYMHADPLVIGEVSRAYTYADPPAHCGGHSYSYGDSPIHW